MILSKVKNMGGKNIPSIMEMIPAEEPDHRTVIEYIELQFDIDINEQFFSQQNLKRIR